MESTSKLFFASRFALQAYTILTLWSQLQNKVCNFLEQAGYIPYWLCGVNFKTWVTILRKAKYLYHIDSVESTSKPDCVLFAHCFAYTILTLWSQLQNILRGWVLLLYVYHIDSVESTSKPFCVAISPFPLYTILTLWSQLQNTPHPTHHHGRLYTILTLWSQLQNLLFKALDVDWVYHIDSVESTSKPPSCKALPSG